MKITVMGDGAWGSALADVLLHNGHEVTMWGPFPEYLAEMAACGENPRFLPGVKFAPGIRFEADAKTAVAGSDVILMASPTRFFRSVATILKPHFDPARQLIIDVAKGIEAESWKRPSEIITEILGPCRLTVVAGPSHAEEVSRGVPTLVVAASHCDSDARLAQSLLMNENFRVYTSDDPIGVELGGALKNVLAVGVGILDGMELGDNPKAAMMTRAITEMMRLGVALGGKAETFSGLSGIGDLIVTCTSRHSRNRRVGEGLGRGLSMAQVQQELGMMVAEGVEAARGVCALAEQAGVEVPICQQIRSILYDGQAPRSAIRTLMTRTPKAER
ncbi:MAG: NAD(P)-dependent glycerol-3-phosphate dehydrogenase [Lentisphaeria bacterium]|nr:NAD(P)-dependent glycerol-3-phosphate dehydrogenase [Lentisphaeria bacterium]